MPSSIKTPPRVPEQRRPRGLLDTSVLIDLDRISEEFLPQQASVSTISLAELAAGPHATTDPEEQDRRRARLDRIELESRPLPFDRRSARAYGQIYALVVTAGRKPRGRRTADLLIAATALASGLPLYTRNPDDFRDLAGLIEVVAVPEPNPAQSDD